VLVEVDASAAIVITDEAFVGATLDWWQSDKCDYVTCSWAKDTLLNIVKLHLLCNFQTQSLFSYNLIEIVARSSCN
jgi:hypothetical protein